MTTLFEGGTPDEPGLALAAYQRAREAGPELRWHVDPGNLGLLSRAVRELSAPPSADADDLRSKKLPSSPRTLEVIVRADDIAEDETMVAHEGDLAPTLRRLRGILPFALTMTNGRPYTLPPPALDITTNDLCGLACNMCGNRATSRDPHTISAADVDTLIEEAAAWGVRRVALTGAGEPFRDPAMLGHIRHGEVIGIKGVGKASKGERCQ